MKKILGLLLLPFAAFTQMAFADVSFYGQCNYKGPAVTLSAGEYSAAELAKVGIPEDAINAVKVLDGFKVTLFEDDGFKGRFGTLTNSDACLEDDNFDKLVSSLIIEAPQPAFGSKDPAVFGSTTLESKKPASSAGSVTVYADCNYKGASATLDVGDYNLAQLKRYGIGNNDISSAKVPPGMSVTVFENDFLRGDSASTSNDVKCIDTGNFANRITSVSVSGSASATATTSAGATGNAVAARNGVVVYDACNYKGNSALLAEGEYTNAQLNKLGIANNSISALQVAEGYQVELYINDFYRGDSGTLATNNPCLIGEYNNSISSIVVSKTATTASSEPVATLYAHCNFRGGSVQLPAGKYDARALKAAVVEDNSVSSIKLSAGYRAVIYSGPSFNSKSVIITGDDDCLDNDDMNEQLSSIVIESIKQNSSASDNFVAQPNKSNTSKSDDLVAGLNCVQQFVEKKACDARRWKAIESRCQLDRVEELSDGYLKGHIEAGNCNAELWDELVRRTANPRLR